MIGQGVCAVHSSASRHGIEGQERNGSWPFFEPADQPRIRKCLNRKEERKWHDFREK